MKPLRCIRCGSTEFGLSAKEEIMFDYDAELTVTCRSCLAVSKGTLMEVKFMEFMEDDINE